MDDFNFVFSIYGLVLGFTLVEVLSGLVRVVKSRDRVRMGWLTPLLAIFVMLDLISWYSGSWATRSGVSVSYGLLLYFLVTSSLYYFAASFVFPETLDGVTDLDDHYFANRRIVLAAVTALAASSLVIGIFHNRAIPPVQAATLVVYFGAMIAAMLSRRKWLNLTALSLLVADYLFWAAIA